MRTIKVLIADNNAKFIQTVKSFLTNEQDIEIVGNARNGKEAISKAKELKPDIILMDVRMPEMNGFKSTSSIKQIMPEVKVIILTIYDIDEYRKAAITSGASGFVVKNVIKDELVQTIREVFE
jgi:DNA-binding NarL/FixJ family response regulator